MFSQQDYFLISTNQLFLPLFHMQMNTNAVQMYAQVTKKHDVSRHDSTVFESVKLTHSLLVELLPNTVKRLSLSLIPALVCVLKAQASITSSKIMFLICDREH